MSEIFSAIFECEYYEFVNVIFIFKHNMYVYLKFTEL